MPLNKSRMARILTDESTLTRKRRSLTRESEWLHTLTRMETGLAGLLVGVGLILYFWKDTASLLVVGLVAAFLAAAHHIKIRENRKEEQQVSAGLRGEATVTRLLQEELPNDTYILNDVNIRRGFRSAQIDHVVVSPKGIFLVETKNWRGKISGDERAPQWSRVRAAGDKPTPLPNPAQQCRRHIDLFRQFLKANHVWNDDVHSILVITPRHAEWNIRNPTIPVLRPGDAAHYIQYFEKAATHPEKEVDQVTGLLMKKARSS